MTNEESNARILIGARWRAGLALHAALEAVQNLKDVQNAPPHDAARMLENASALGETIEVDSALARADFERLIRKVEANA